MVSFDIKLNDGEFVRIKDVHVRNLSDLVNRIGLAATEGFLIFGDIAIKKKDISYFKLVGDSK